MSATAIHSYLQLLRATQTSQRAHSSRWRDSSEAVTISLLGLPTFGSTILNVINAEVKQLCMVQKSPGKIDTTCNTIVMPWFEGLPCRIRTFCDIKGLWPEKHWGKTRLWTSSKLVAAAHWAGSWQSCRKWHDHILKILRKGYIILSLLNKLVTQSHASSAIHCLDWRTNVRRDRGAVCICV